MKILAGRLILLSLFIGYSQKLIFAQEIRLDSSNLPIVVIETGAQSIPNSPKITASMGIIFNGTGKLNYRTNPFNHFNGTIGIELRGQSSQDLFPMKSYDIELRTSTGVELNQPLLGMPAESDWVLYAPYTDKTLMRNFLAYTLTQQMGRWASRISYVELVVDNDYKGIYLLMEKIKRGADRVNISRLQPTENSGTALTGGYIFSLDKQPNGWFSKFTAPNASANRYRQFSYVYPKADIITAQQKNYIKSFVDEFENTLAGPDFQHPTKGVRKTVDLPSFADYFIMNELSRNVDGYRLSSYFHKNKLSVNDRIVAGPVWDYDLAFRNANYCNGSDVGGWAFRFNYVCPGDGAGLVPFWWERLLLDTAYAGSLRCRWEDLRKNILSEKNINHLIDSIATLTSDARGRHFKRWPILGQYVWPNPNPIPVGYEDEIASLKSWIRARADWIDQNLEDKGACGTNQNTNVENLAFKFFPNPFETRGYLQFQSVESGVITVYIKDMLGRTIMKKQYSIFPGNNRIELDTQVMRKGIYHVTITDIRNTVQTIRILKQ
ncbi:MAG: hypothetical protein RLZZ420_2594 [Bacteroidota bacterium]|jgi:hypothetical protein